MHPSKVNGSFLCILRDSVNEKMNFRNVSFKIGFHYWWQNKVVYIELLGCIPAFCCSEGKKWCQSLFTKHALLSLAKHFLITDPEHRIQKLSCWFKYVSNSCMTFVLIIGIHHEFSLLIFFSEIIQCLCSDDLHLTWIRLSKMGHNF